LATTNLAVAGDESRPALSSTGQAAGSPPVVYAVANLRSDQGGYTHGSSLVADFTVTLEGFSGVIYNVQGGYPIPGGSIDMIYIALQIGS